MSSRIASPTDKSITTDNLPQPKTARNLALTGIFVMGISGALGALVLIHINGGHSLGCFNFVGKLGTNGAYCSIAFGVGFGGSLLVAAAREHYQSKKIHSPRHIEESSDPVKPVIGTPTSAQIQNSKPASGPTASTPTTSLSSNPTPSTNAPNPHINPYTPNKNWGAPSKAEIALCSCLNLQIGNLLIGEWTIVSSSPYFKKDKYELLAVRRQDGLHITRINPKDTLRMEEFNSEFMKEFGLIPNTFVKFVYLPLMDHIRDQGYKLTKEKDIAFDFTYVAAGLVLRYEIKDRGEDIEYHLWKAFHKDDPEVKEWITQQLQIANNASMDQELAEWCQLEPGQWTIIPPGDNHSYATLVIRKDDKLEVIPTQISMEESFDMDKFLKKHQLRVEDYTLCFENYFDYDRRYEKRVFEQNSLGLEIQEQYKAFESNPENLGNSFSWKIANLQNP